MASISYEIHAEENYSWRIHAVLDSLEIALLDARRLYSSGRYDRVRVVREEVEGNPYLAQVEANLFIVESLGEEKPGKSRKKKTKAKASAPKIGAPLASQAQQGDAQPETGGRGGQDRAAADRAAADRALAREKSDMLGGAGGPANINPNTVIILMFAAVVVMAVALIFVLFFK